MLRLEQLIILIDGQNLAATPAQTFKKSDDYDTVLGILSFKHQKMYRLLLQWESEVEDLINRLTDSIELHFEECQEEGHSKEKCGEFHASIRQKLKQENFKIKQYKWIKINFDAELETLFEIPEGKFIGIRDGTTVVYRDDNNRGDKSLVEEFCFEKNESALLLSGIKMLLVEILKNDDTDLTSSGLNN